MTARFGGLEPHSDLGKVPCVGWRPSTRDVQAEPSASQMPSQPSQLLATRADGPPCGCFLNHSERSFFVVFFVPAQNGNLLKSQKRFIECEMVSHPVLASNPVFLPRKICAEERKSPRASHKHSVWSSAALWFLKNSIYICKLGRLNSYLVDWE